MSQQKDYRVKPINDADRDNMKSLGLNESQIRYHNHLMTRTMKTWPEGLKTFVRNSGQSPCGDVLACLVADWIKTAPGFVQGFLGGKED